MNIHCNSTKWWAAKITNKVLTVRLGKGKHFIILDLNEMKNNKLSKRQVLFFD
jgi:hypothetical protein